MVQNYFAVGDNVFLTAVFAMLPILFLFWALLIKKMKAYKGIFFAWILTLLTAIFIFRMPPLTAVSAAAYGALQGIFPLCWLVFNAVFLYNLIVKSGKFEVIKYSIASISNDRRVQAILIGFCFSAFLEGSTAFGAPVAISAAMLTGLGFPAMKAVVICLVGNTFPVPFGPIGLPTMITVSTAFGDNPSALLAVTSLVGGIMSFYALIIPILMLIILCGRKAALEVLPLCIVTSVCYIIPNLFITRYLGPQLPSLLSPIISLAGLICFLRIYKPKRIWRFDEDPSVLHTVVLHTVIAPNVAEPDAEQNYSGVKIAHAWLPFMMLTVFMVIWSLPQFKDFSAALPIKINIGEWPFLHGFVYQASPITETASLYAAVFNFDLLAAAGTAIFIITIFTKLIFKLQLQVFWEVFVSTLKQLKFAIAIMILVLSIAQVSNYSGISFTLGLAFAAAGTLFMVFSPIIGFTGVFLTGSIASSGALFGNLQRISAEQLGLEPIITITANIAGSAMGKLISPQSLTIGAAAIGLSGKEGSIMGKMVKYAFGLLGICVIIMLVLTYIY